MALTSFGEESERLLREVAAVYSTGSARDVAGVLHMLRGIAATVGARALARQAGKIEAVARTALDTPARQIISADMIATLDLLISDSSTLLQQALDKEPVSPSANEPKRSCSAIAEHTVQWSKLLVMLGNGDMQSLDLIDGLERDVKDTEKSDVALLATQIRNLDFDRAIITLELLLKGER
jgi:HPt (histidine-containing phosphotransfer) domain-containing protein